MLLAAVILVVVAAGGLVFARRLGRELAWYRRLRDPSRPLDVRAASDLELQLRREVLDGRGASGGRERAAVAGELERRRWVAQMRDRWARPPAGR